MNINGVSLDIDLNCEDDLNKYKQALNNLGKGIEDVSKAEIASKYKIPFYSMIICNFFNDLFGEGTHEVLFGEYPSFNNTYNTLKNFYNDIVERK